MLFVDTSAWFAFFVPTDPDHLRIRNWLTAQREPVLTTDYCIDETLTLLVARRELVRALEAGRELFERGIARVHFITPDQIQRAWVFFQQHYTAGWSFTDCTSFVVITELGIRKAAALDTHFQQFPNVQIGP